MSNDYMFALYWKKSVCAILVLIDGENYSIMKKKRVEITADTR